MEITVNDLSSVDKEITVTAQPEDLQPAIESALRKIRSQAALPGFRPGKAPLGLIKKRFKSDIEIEEAQKFVNTTFEKEIAPNYDLFGQSQFLDLDIPKDGGVTAVFKIGIKPTFDLVPLAEIEVEKMVHDVNDEDVQKELDYLAEKEGEWVEVDEEVTTDHKVEVRMDDSADEHAHDDHSHDENLDESSEDELDDVEDADIVEDEDEDSEALDDSIEELDLREEKNKAFAEQLVGRNVGDTVEVVEAHGDHSHTYRVTILKVLKLEPKEITDEFIAETTKGEEASTVEEYKALMRSKLQEYYDETALNMAQQEFVEKLLEAHTLDIPETIIDQLVEQFHKEQKEKYKVEGELDIAPFLEGYRTKALNDGKWFLISEKLQALYSDEVEVTEADLDKHFSKMGAQYGIDASMIRSILGSNAEQLESISSEVKFNKILSRALDDVTVHELDREQWKQKKENQPDTVTE